MKVKTATVTLDGDSVLFIEASAVVAYVIAWAAHYADTHEYADRELHPIHYDTIKVCGARMDQFTRREKS